MMAEAERALVGVEEIAAFIETLWRERLKRRGVRVASRTVRRWLHRGRDPLPAHRLCAGGAWVAAPSEVLSWWERHLVSSTAMSAVGQIAPIGRSTPPTR
jgi:hypothetical protein